MTPFFRTCLNPYDQQEDLMVLSSVVTTLVLHVCPNHTAVNATLLNYCPD